MNNQSKKKLLVLHTLEEEAAFWETHSAADYWDEMKSVQVNFKVTPLGDDSMIIEVPYGQKAK